MIMPIDIDKKSFSRDKRGYNSREVDEFLDLIIVDYEKVLNDNRAMAQRIKFLEKQLDNAQKSDGAMLETLETAKRLMADISASAERRAELIMRDAELESENLILEAKATVKKMNEEHLVLKGKVERLRANYRQMLESEMKKLDGDEYALLPEMDRSDIPDIERELASQEKVEEQKVISQDTLVTHPSADRAKSAPVEEKLEVKEEAMKAETLSVPGNEPVTDKTKATLSDLSDSLKQMAGEHNKIDDTIILK